MSRNHSSTRLPPGLSVSREPLKVVDVEVTEPITTIENLGGYSGVKALVRVRNVPVGYVPLPVHGDRCLASEIATRIVGDLRQAIFRELARGALCDASRTSPIAVERLFDPVSYPDAAADWPTVTVAVCTRDRAENLRPCLDGLSSLDYPSLDLLVVDNAPRDDSTAELVRKHYPQIRYLVESHPGLDWARNCAIENAHGDILAFTDDDVVVDRHWVSALADIMRRHPDVMAVTGLVTPYELETPPQILFEEYGGFGRGFDRRWFRMDKSTARPTASYFAGAGAFGTGANMAFRKKVFEDIGNFDPALDVGTVTNGGGDLDMFFRILKEGHTLVYEPRAVVRHRHRRRYEKLREQIRNNGIGLYSYFVRNSIEYPKESFAFLRFGIKWWYRGIFRRLLVSCYRPPRIPRRLIWAEVLGSLIGLSRYQQARKHCADCRRERLRRRPTEKAASGHTAVRDIDISRPLEPITDVSNYREVRLIVRCEDRLLGATDIVHLGQSISVPRLADAITDTFWHDLIDDDDREASEEFRRLLRRKLGLAGNWREPRLPDRVSVSIVVATLDRPEDLRNCLKHLLRQNTERDVEIVVVDNNPGSGQTPPIVNEFPGVKLVEENRRGLSYARNAGIVVSTGEIIVSTDDDVTVPEHWLEKLVAPFSRNDVMIVAGNVLPIEMETEPQAQFEQYGGLGKGFNRFEVNRDWFDGVRVHTVPTWILGATANAAFRASIFADREIGLLPEELGPGTPAGVGEDTYVFYKTLKRGHTMVYEPDAAVRHKHRKSSRALRQQIFAYSKGHVAYNLFIVVRDRDFRGLRHVLISLPWFHVRRIVRAILGRSRYRPSLALVEIWGNLLGPWVLIRSIRRARRLGPSEAYVPVAERRVPAGARRRSPETRVQTASAE